GVAVGLRRPGNEVRAAAFPELRHVILLDAQAQAGTVAWPALEKTAAAVSDSTLATRIAIVDPDAPTFIMYTSGTTGFPKGAVHSHKLIRNVEDRTFRMPITHNDAILNYPPMSHACGFSEGALASFITGARQVITRTFDPEACVDLIERERVTLVHGFEVHMKGLTEAQEARPRDVSSLR